MIRREQVLTPTGARRDDRAARRLGRWLASAGAFLEPTPSAINPCRHFAPDLVRRDHLSVCNLRASFACALVLLGRSRLIIDGGTLKQFGQGITVAASADDEAKRVLSFGLGKLFDRLPHFSFAVMPYKVAPRPAAPKRHGAAPPGAEPQASARPPTHGRRGTTGTNPGTRGL